MRHPVIKLDEQFRYRSVFTEWPNLRTYGDGLKSHASTESIAVSPGYLEATRECITSTHDSNIDLGNLVVSVDGSTCVIDDASKSRYNDEHRRFVLSVLLANANHDGYEGKDIKIITPYLAQVIRYRQSLFRMVKLRILSPDQIPIVATTDSMQGKESRLVIYDWVLSNSSKTSDLGFPVDDHRGNVGQTRI